MSFFAMRWAIEQTGLTTVQKMVLLILADAANKTTGYAWPSGRRIATMGAMSVRSVRNAICVLEQRRLIVRVAGKWRTAKWQLPVDDQQTVLEPANSAPDAHYADDNGCAREAPMCAADAPQDAGRAHKPIKNPTNNRERARKNVSRSLVSNSDEEGTRLPEGWKPDDQGKEFARDLGLDLKMTLEKFTDYWSAQPGENGRRTNWPAVWRMWCRREGEISGKTVNGYRPGFQPGVV